MSAAHGLTRWLVLVLVAAVLCVGCAEDGDDGDDGKRGRNGTDGTDGTDGAPGFALINAATAPADYLDSLDVESEITGVTIASPPQVFFTVTTDQGVPITGIGHYWQLSNRYVRFTITKLVPGADGTPDTWVAYVRDEGEPDYDTGASLVDNGDGTYVFTFLTDVANVAGVPYEPTLTHRVAGQIGSGSVPIEAQNLVMDFVPAGGAVTRTRNIAVVASCNECHDRLSEHGRRFEVEYCVNCHNPDLASGEGNMSFMIHRLHSAGSFDILDDAIDYSEVTYPQDVNNCRKCHNGADAATAQGDNWKNLPNAAACDGCHDNFGTPVTHTAGAQPDTACAGCHPADAIEGYHVSENATPNNPDLPAGQRSITYELIEATVDAGNDVTVKFKILSDGTPLDLTSLPTDLLVANRYPGLLLAWAEAQDGIMMPVDFNNLGRDAGQPISLGLGDFSPIETDEPVGTLTFSAVDGVLTATIPDAENQFPVGARMRTVGLQGYLRQDLDADGAYDVSLHTPSAVVTVTGDTARRQIVDSDNCAKCHEWFEGHGGNRVYEIGICTMCHVPNLSSSGRSIDPDDIDEDVEDELGDDPLTYPEDAQNLKDLVHGIHSSGFRTTDYEHVRGGRQGYYNWSHVTFPAETNNCTLCHLPGTYRLPLSLDALPTTVRTTYEFDGDDESTEDVADAIDDVPNDTDWVNSPTASSCYYCHDSAAARAHMMQNGGQISEAKGVVIKNRVDFMLMESCAVCHGPGKTADLDVVHGR